MEIYTRLALGEQRRFSPENDPRVNREHAPPAPPFLSSRASNRLSQRFGLSPTAAAAIASLAGLGPQEVRQ